MIPSSNVRNTSGGEAVGSANNIEDIMLKNKEKILDKIPKNGQVYHIRLTFENKIMKIIFYDRFEFYMLVETILCI